MEDYFEHIIMRGSTTT